MNDPEVKQRVWRDSDRRRSTHRLSGTRHQPSLSASHPPLSWLVPSSRFTGGRGAKHKDGIAATDFFVVPTARFQLLYVWFAIDHGRRRVIHFNVTTNPTVAWVVQQLREALPADSAPRYLLYDRDSIFSAAVTAAIRTSLTQPVRIAFRSPWQNSIAERWVGTCRRELLDIVIVFGDRHLRRLLSAYVAYYNAERGHTRLTDAPGGWRTETCPSPAAKRVGLPRVPSRGGPDLVCRLPLAVSTVSSFVPV